MALSAAEKPCGAVELCVRAEKLKIAEAVCANHPCLRPAGTETESSALPTPRPRHHRCCPSHPPHHVQDPIRFVQDQRAQRAAVKARRLVHVLEQAAGRGDQDVEALHACLLLRDVLAADQDPGAQLVPRTDLSQLIENLPSGGGGRSEERV